MHVRHLRQRIRHRAALDFCTDGKVRPVICAVVDKNRLTPLEVLYLQRIIKTHRRAAVIEWRERFWQCAD